MNIRLQHAIGAISIALMIGAIVMANLAIMYSSIPHYQQEGWAIFCGLNAIWIFALGVLAFAGADSMAQERELQRRRRVLDTALEAMDLS